jgi:uncharacterized membrane protein YsdA (DUF1294 family)
MNNFLLGIIIFFLAVNLAAFVVMMVDKKNSRRAGAERISESFLFFMAAFFGSLGVFLGMMAFRHKTQKWYFILGIPMLMAENCALLYVAYNFLLLTAK